MDTADNDQDRRLPGEALAETLRRWWETSARQGRDKPTQQSLALRLGIDQTTLSRYLNPRHPSTAPLRVVEALHTHLRAPLDELERARALSAQATASAARRPPAHPARNAESTTDAASGPATEEPPPTVDAVTPDAVPPDAVVAVPPGTATAVPTGTTTAVPPDTTTAVPPPARADAAAGAVVLSSAAVPAVRRASRTAAALVAACAVLALVAGLTGWRLLASSGTGERAENAAATSARAAVDDGDWVLVQEGDRFWKATTVQYLLVAHGHDLKVDGIFGPRTATAVKSFQTEHRLLPDAKVGPRTWPLLVRYVDSGSRGPAVEALQNLLTNTGLPTDITGIFSAATGASLRTFQQTHGLPASGRADPDTWRVLLAAQLPPIRTHRS